MTPPRETAGTVPTGPARQWKNGAVLETFTADTFRPHLDDRFELILDDDHRFGLELVEVNETDVLGAKRRAQFSIVFSGPADPILPQRVYHLEHPEIGSFYIFLVPIAAGSYEAVFT
jgi:hypothetical protein